MGKKALSLSLSLCLYRLQSRVGVCDDQVQFTCKSGQKRGDDDLAARSHRPPSIQPSTGAERDERSKTMAGAGPGTIPQAARCRERGSVDCIGGTPPAESPRQAISHCAPFMASFKSKHPHSTPWHHATQRYLLVCIHEVEGVQMVETGIMREESYAQENFAAL